MDESFMHIIYKYQIVFILIDLFFLYFIQN